MASNQNYLIWNTFALRYERKELITKTKPNEKIISIKVVFEAKKYLILTLIRRVQSTGAENSTGVEGMGKEWAINFMAIQNFFSRVDNKNTEIQSKSLKMKFKSKTKDKTQEIVFRFEVKINSLDTVFDGFHDFSKH